MHHTPTIQCKLYQWTIITTLLFLNTMLHTSIEFTRIKDKFSKTIQHGYGQKIHTFDSTLAIFNLINIFLQCNKSRNFYYNSRRQFYYEKQRLTH